MQGNTKPAFAGSSTAVAALPMQPLKQSSEPVGNHRAVVVSFDNYPTPWNE